MDLMLSFVLYASLEDNEVNSLIIGQISRANLFTGELFRYIYEQIERWYNSKSYGHKKSLGSLRTW